MEAEMAGQNYVCPKCGNTDSELDQFHAAGGLLSRLFDVQHKRFTTVTCTRCRYTELYKADTRTTENILDFLASS
ncbi:MAG: zinc ribbon domain-containing protein [Anaerolineae bacterium]